MALGSMHISTILTLPIHKYGISFHLFVSFSISFINVFKFLVCRSFTFLVNFIPKYFVVFNSTVFFISFSDCSLLVYRNATDFLYAYLDPETTEFVYYI